jgi:glycosyltransferase involved in cell wall biosynthesis
MDRVLLITIGIPCFNEGPLLREAWESVLAQECDEWNAVAVLDGESDPQTVDVFRSLEHPRLRKIVNPRNLGPFPTKAKAIEASTTPYFLFLDGDDLLPPNAVGDVVNCLWKDPVDFVCGDWLVFGDGMGSPRRQQGHIPTFESVVDRRMWHCVTAWSRDIFFRVGGYPSELAWGPGDIDFVLSLLENDARGTYIPSMIYEYRQRQRMTVSKSGFDRLADVAEVLVKRHPKVFADAERRRNYLLTYLAEQA